jgi:hypothetical protein
MRFAEMIVDVGQLSGAAARDERKQQNCPCDLDGEGCPDLCVTRAAFAYRCAAADASL